MPGMPAARVMDMHACPMVTPGTLRVTSAMPSMAWSAIIVWPTTVTAWGTSRNGVGVRVAVEMTASEVARAATTSTGSSSYARVTGRTASVSLSSTSALKPVPATRRRSASGAVNRPVTPGECTGGTSPSARTCMPDWRANSFSALGSAWAGIRKTR